MTLVAPLAIFWIAALALSLADGRRRAIGVLGLIALVAGFAAMARLTLEVAANGPLEMVAGNWPSGVGITLRADALGVAFAMTAIAVLLVAYGFELAGGIESRTFPALTLFLAAGLTGVFITGDAFNFYVFFEISMVSSYILTAYGEERRQLRAAVIFAVVNLLGSVILAHRYCVALSHNGHARHGGDRGTHADRRGEPRDRDRHACSSSRSG